MLLSNNTDKDSTGYVDIANSEPAIELEKLVSPDEGQTFFDADNPPGPTIPQGTDPVFRYIVTNIGNVTLQNINLFDSVLDPITIPTTTLNPGESFTFDVTGAWVEGENVNEAIVIGVFANLLYTDTDPAYYLGVVEASPAINITKFVSVDDGETWEDADTPPGPFLPPNVTPQFRFVVTNTGNVTLTDIEVTDDVLGPIATLQSLAPGQSEEWIIVES